ncbi:hypothetical protein [Actinoplanes couchii]|uniref:Secreted protein n=1 Tax=Actinoplanes couchii TaxID=403638 RepID=A0ABQ3XMY5_9ACTN|nr:hypothetical protein [Actinoplanes couchii]MDR6317793.1 hypothetical protein [Actinoplanes couchii]GID59782.1 hypothetical protein Aco03nite_081860 [Actinoplanes couchii]
MKSILLVTMLAGAGLSIATPAQAETTCGPAKNVELSTPGFDTDLSVTLCVTHGSLDVGAYAIVNWKDGGSGGDDGNRKFDSLLIHYQLQAYDEVLASGSCNLSGRVNGAEKGTRACKTVYPQTSRAGGLNARGYVDYNVDRDGLGTKRFDLVPTPFVTS